MSSYQRPKELDYFEEKYHVLVRCHLNEGDLELALIGADMLNAEARLIEAQIARAHMGLSVLATSEVLAKRIKEGDAKRIARTQEIFEAYLAQTNL